MILASAESASEYTLKGRDINIRLHYIPDHIPVSTIHPADL